MKTMEELLGILKEAFKNSWMRETAVDPLAWSPENPAWGQCVVTALIVQDCFGGKLLRAFFDVTVNGQTQNVSHYWNQLPDGREIDFTGEQFLKEGIVHSTIPPGKEKTREYVLSYPDTVTRYKLLEKKVREYLKYLRLQQIREKEE